MDTRYAPKTPPFSGVMVSKASAGPVGTITANVTNTFFLAVPPGRHWIRRAAVVCNVVGVDADGNLTATFQKYNGATDTPVALNTANNLKTLTTKEMRDIVVTATLTDAQRIVDSANGDSLYVEVVSDSAAIDTQPTQLIFTVELLTLR